jgi:hypothetical protein
MVQGAGFDRITVQIAQEQQLTIDPDVSFKQAWACSSRFGIQLAPEKLDRIKAQYIGQFTRLVQNQEEWNHDYEQYVVAHKPQ